MRTFIFLLTILIHASVYSQFVVNEPLVNIGNFAITDSVYMDPNGNDANPGTFALPVKSFSKAVQKLPFGVAGINGGNAYGVIRLKPGHYVTSSSFRQNTTDWKNGNTYKNISVEGLGDVVIGGTKDSFSGAHLLLLCGNHIFIRNIKLKYSNGMGVLLNRNDASLPRQNNVLIENVIVDSVGSFSMLLTGIDSILVRRSKSLYSSRPGNSNLTTPCQWPSGIKFFNSTNCIIYDSEIAYSRGEGLNFQNSLECLAYRNKLHDNGLNFYNDNSAKLIIHSNHIYNTPNIGTQYWRNCPADTGKIWATAGMLIANEGSCVFGNLPGFTGCQTKCVLPNESFSNVDSMFIYNNIMQNVGEAISFWEGSNTITGVNCIRNVFFFNNTIIGVMGMPGTNLGSLIKAFFPDYNIVLNSYYGYLQNVKITNNIFTYDTVAYPNMRPLRLVFHPQHPGPKDITFNNNLWISGHANMGTTDVVRNNMPGYAQLLTDSLSIIQPCPQHPYWVATGSTPFPMMGKDYLGRNRNVTTTNVGALEYATNCEAAFTGISNNEKKRPIIYPNPCISCKTIRVENLDENETYNYSLFSPDGKKITAGILHDNSIDAPEQITGVYILIIQGQGKHHFLKLVLQ